MSATASVTQKKRSSIPYTKSDKFLKILIEKRRDELNHLVQELT